MKLTYKEIVEQMREFNAHAVQAYKDEVDDLIASGSNESVLKIIAAEIAAHAMLETIGKDPAKYYDWILGDGKLDVEIETGAVRYGGRFLNQ